METMSKDTINNNAKRQPCSICGGDIDVQPHGWSGGHNALPVAEGKCCTECNNNIVIPSRLIHLVPDMDGEKIIHYTPNGNILTADECLCTIDCVECDREIDLHEEDTMGEHCLTCYWLKREVIDADDYEGNKEWYEIRLTQLRGDVE